MMEAQELFKPKDHKTGQVIQNEVEGSESEEEVEFQTIPVQEAMGAKKGRRFEKPASLNELFKLKGESEAKYNKTITKINSDDVSMMKQLIAKYSQDFKVSYSAP